MSRAVVETRPIQIIAGPCSIDDQNIAEVYQIAGMEVSDGQGGRQRANVGTRVVGLKSRTDLDLTGKGMGLDAAVIFNRNPSNESSEQSNNHEQVPPSVLY